MVVPRVSSSGSRLPYSYADPKRSRRRSLCSYVVVGRVFGRIDDAIAAVVDDFIGRLAGDKRFERFFAGFSDDSKKRLRQHILDQFCVAAGGPCVYMGRDMKTTHKGLGITEADWDVAAKHLVASLDKYKVPQAEKDELLAFVVAQKKDIVEK